MELATLRRDERKQKYEQVWALQEQGYQGKAIARKLGIGKTTVFRYLRTPLFLNAKDGATKVAVQFPLIKNIF